ncbi:MAG: OmpA family protein [Epsilonproteobacteria bacterium]|nr:OmpA family protein [Campylobacterota bacterium]
MKKNIFILAVAAALLATGCSQKEPEVDMTQQNGANAAAGSANGAASSVDGGLDTIQGSVESSNLTSEEAKMAKIHEIEATAKKIYFDFDKYNIRPDQQANVDEDAELFMSPEAKDLTVKIEGNCDEWGTDEYNYALGLKRAKTVRDALALKGIPESRMVMVSYGESNPVCTEHTQECWAKNRRVEFKLLP